jgi:phage terminase large subunit-like protein
VIRLKLPRLHAFQQSIADHPARYKTVTAGRRTGKSILGRHLIITTALSGLPCAYLAPTFSMARRMWRDLCNILAPLTVEKSEQEKELRLLGGGTIRIYSLESFDRIRGEHFALVVIDEAAMVPDLEEAWTKAIRPTLTDLQGRAVFLSTPRGRQYFWLLFQRGSDPRYPAWASFQAPTSVNPHIRASEIEEMRGELPERVFRQEVLAEFLSTEGAVFRNIEACAVAAPQSGPVDGHSYVMGADFGRTNDATAVIVYDLTLRAAVTLDRYVEPQLSVQVDRIDALCRLWRPLTVLAESNSFGIGITQALQKRGLPVQPFVTTNATKAHIIDALALALETAAVSFVPDEVLKAELYAYESETLPSGLVRYSAPSGQHDDTCVALALAHHAATNGVVTYTSSPF